MDRISTGVQGLDTMLRGGLIPGRPYVVTGPSGSGKTILAMHFLLEGLRNGEPCMLVALDEPPSEVKANISSFGWGMDQLTALDATPDIRQHKKRNVIDVGTTLDVRDMEQVQDVRKSLQLRTMEVTIHSVQKMIKQTARDLLEGTGRRYTRIVIDSMTALKRFSMRGEDSRVMLQSFLRFLSELEVTTLLVSNPLFPKELETEFLISRGQIQLHKWIDGHSVRRGISVERMRGTGFDDVLRPMVIGPHGVTVYPNAAISARGALLHGVGRPFLEGRVLADVNARLDEVLELLESVRREGGETAEAESALLRGVVGLHRRRYEESMRYLITAKAKLTEEMRLHEAARRARGKAK